MSFLSFEMTELDQNIFDTVILEHPVCRGEGMPDDHLQSIKFL